nr:GNAT family N-acetyltransferase [Arenimonas daejeonensis]
MLGGGGVAPLDGGPEGVCELRKMYFLPELRGRGAGATLMAHCLDAARTWATASVTWRPCAAWIRPRNSTNAPVSGAWTGRWAPPGISAATASTCWTCSPAAGPGAMH